MKVSILWIGLMAFALTGPSRAEAPNPRMAWLREGAMVISTTHAMVTQQMLKLDRDGQLIDPGTGRHYAPSDRQGASASGWSQATIAAIDGDKAVVSVNLFSDARATGQADPALGMNGLSYVLPVTGGKPGDLWIDPERLAAVQSNVGQGLLVAAVQWTNGSTAHDATRIDSDRPDSYSMNVYDRKTGLLLHFFQTVQSRPPNVVGPLDGGAKNWNTYWGDFISVRDVAVPWAGEVLPDAVQALKGLEYSGTITFANMTLGRPQSFRFSAAVMERGNGWLKVQGSMLQQGMPAPVKSEIYYGHAQFAAPWAGPAALAKLREGQVLDEDPITRVKITVTKARGGTVIISQRNASGEVKSEYDARSGLLVGSSHDDGVSKQRWEMRLVRKE